VFCPAPIDKGPEAGRRDNVDCAILIEISGEQVRANAAMRVDELRDEFRSSRSFRVANSAVPGEDGCSCGVRINVGVEMREPYPRKMGGEPLSLRFTARDTLT
jgi:hypothetical protein